MLHSINQFTGSHLRLLLIVWVVALAIGYANRMVRKYRGRGFMDHRDRPRWS